MIYIAKRKLRLNVRRVDTWQEPPRATSHSEDIEEGEEFTWPLPEGGDWDNGMNYTYSLKVHEDGGNQEPHEDAESGRDYEPAFIAKRERESQG